MRSAAIPGPAWARGGRRTLAGASIAIACLAGTAAAQGPPSGVGPPPGVGGPGTYTIVPVQTLDFGVMLPGVQGTVSTADAFSRGEVQVSGNGFAYVKFTLPTDLTAASGVTVPLQFVNGDAAYQASGSTTLTYFDPSVGVRVNLSTEGPITVFLGGRALPSATQIAGSYSAAVTVVVSATSF